MAQIPRPPKQGNVTTYTAKVAAGYARILAGEVDADFDTIFGAWNAGADTVNIRDGAVTSAKLSADAVGPRELQDGGIGTANLGDASVTTAKIADGAVTDPKIVSLGWAKLTGVPVAPTSLPPSGPATGDLSGTYPAPVIRDGAVTMAKVGGGAVDTARLALDAATQFADSGGPVFAPPIHLGLDLNEQLLHVHSASAVSRGGLIFVLGICSGVFGSIAPQSIIARLRMGGSPTGVDGTVIGSSTARGGDSDAKAIFPLQMTVMALVRGVVNDSGPFKLTAQLLGMTGTSADIYDVQCVAFELA